MIFDDVVRGYTGLWWTCRVNPVNSPSLIDETEVQKAVDRCLANRGRYEAVAGVVKCPWWFIAAIHSLESSFSFEAHLHNGDPLDARTTHVPEGRPLAGKPPFTWEASALDALIMPPHRLDQVPSWTIPRALWEWERYNGLGYFGRGPSPYLWSGTNHYERGKFVKDHVYDANAVSKQVGAAAILRRLVALGVVIDDTPAPATPKPGPQIMADAPVQPLSEFLKSLPPAIAVTAPTIISMADGPSAPIAVKALAEALPGPVAPTAEAVENKIHSIPIVGDILSALAAAERAVNGIVAPGVPAAPAGETVQTTETTNIPAPPMILGPILVGFDALFPALVGFKTPAAIIIAGIACAVHYSGLVPSPEAFATALSLAAALGGIGIVQKIDRAGSTITQVVSALRPAKTRTVTKV